MPETRSNIFEGRTLEEAVNKGLSALRLSRAEAMITVMQEGSSGFLGFGSRPFRVRMTARPGGAIREPEEQKERRVRAGRPERGGRTGRERGGRGGREGGGRERVAGGDRPARAGGSAPAPGRGERRERGPEERRGRGPREERRPEPPRVEEPRAEEPVAQAGESRERPRGERGGRGGRRGRRERGPREGRRERGPEPEPLAASDEHANDRPEDRQPRFGMRGFEDRRRPGDRREEDGAPPAGSDERRQSGERRGEMGEAEGEAGDAGRRRRRGRRGGRRRHRGEEGAVAEPMTGAMPMAPIESDEEFAPSRAEAPMEGEESFVDEPVNGGDEMPAETSDRGFDRPRRRGREERGDRGERRDREPRESREPREPAMSGEQLQALTRQVTEDLMRAMGFDATVTITPEDEEKVNVTVQVTEGEEFLTGRKGETRQALQHLLNRMVNRGEGSRYHVQLEINDFWAQREKELEQQARQMADDAISSGNEQVTDYLNAQERRIIHVTLREDTRVRTYAIGDGMIKRLAVAPAQFAETTEPLE